MELPIWEDKSILIVEDDEISLEFLKEILIPSRAKVFVATNGQEAIDICAKNPSINLVLMDIQLPLISGKDAMIEIKKTNPDAYMIAQTAFAMSGDKERYLEAGFDDYISKPIILDELIEKLIKIFAS